MTYDYHLAGSSSPPNIGQLKSVSSSVSTIVYGYGPLGNITTSAQNLTGYASDFVFVYDWYLNGGLKSIQYPSGRQVSYDVDDAGRSNKAYTTGKTYADMTASGITYPFTPDGRIAQMKLGNNLFKSDREEIKRKSVSALKTPILNKSRNYLWARCAAMRSSTIPRIRYCLCQDSLLTS